MHRAVVRRVRVPLSAALRAQGHDVGRYKAGSLMQEAGLVSKQLRKHRFKNAEGESRVAANHLDRTFTVQQPNQVWCGDVSFGSGLSLHQHDVSPNLVALSHQAKHESSWQLLGQCTDGTFL